MTTTLAETIADVIRSPEAREAFARFRASVDRADLDDDPPSRRPTGAAPRTEAERRQRSAAAFARLARDLYASVPALPAASVVEAQMQSARISAEARRAAGVLSPEEHALDDQPGEYDGCLGDFRYIRDLYEDIGPAATASRRFLEEAVRPGDIVITHHLPHPRCIAPQYAGSPLNRFFLHNVANVVERGDARLWIHGHTHTSVDVTCGGTRVVCNPLGYPRDMPGEPNPAFSLHAIEVP